MVGCGTGAGAQDGCGENADEAPPAGCDKQLDRGRRRGPSRHLKEGNDAAEDRCAAEDDNA